MVFLVYREGSNPYQSSGLSCSFCEGSGHDHFDCDCLKSFIEMGFLSFHNRKLYDCDSNDITFEVRPWYISNSFKNVLRLALAKWAKEESSSVGTTHLVNQNAFSLAATLEDEVNENSTTITSMRINKKADDIFRNATKATSDNKNPTLADLIEKSYPTLRLDSKWWARSDYEGMVSEIILDAVLQSPIQEFSFNKVRELNDRFLSTFIDRIHAASR